jgi:two-component system, OmpR family, heavy metal sensor histidine kinase CusS
MTSHLADKPPLSLKARVMLLVGLAFIVCLLLLRIVIDRSVEQHFKEQDAMDLQAAVDSVQQTLLRYGSQTQQYSEALAQTVPLHPGLAFEVREMDGDLLYRGSTANLEPLFATASPVARITPESLLSWEDSGHAYRGAIARVPVNGRTLLVAAAVDMEFHHQFMISLRRTLWLIMAGAGLLTLSAAWLALRQGLVPLQRLSERIRDIRTDSLEDRLEPATVPGELTTLVESQNHMLAELQEGFARLSNFSADIAHELRTPLTSLITQTQVMLGSDRSAHEYRELLHSNLEELERLARMVGDMLWLAQTERGLIRPGSEILDMAIEVNALFDYFAAWAEEKDVELKCSGPAAKLRGDRAMIRRALANLLSNAIRHTPVDGRVVIQLSDGAHGRVAISVQNTGPEIAAAQLSKVFYRFYRIDPSRHRHDEGAGLGLAIVKSIVELHGGEIRASSRAGVTTFTMSFPADRDGTRKFGATGQSAAEAER